MDRTCRDHDCCRTKQIAERADQRWESLTTGCRRGIASESSPYCARRDRTAGGRNCESQYQEQPDQSDPGPKPKAARGNTQDNACLIEREITKSPDESGDFSCMKSRYNTQANEHPRPHH